jgi:hypothetical protein
MLIFHLLFRNSTTAKNNSGAKTINGTGIRARLNDEGLAACPVGL